jgi:hypothetical protein
MSRSPALACALVCALLCATTVVAAATPPPAPGTASNKPTSPAASGTSAGRQPAGASATATPPGKTAPSAPSGKPATGTAQPNGAAKKAPAVGSKTPPAKPKPKLNELQEIDWRDLLPESDRKKYNPNAPAPVHGPLGEGGPPAVQVVTTSVNEDLDQALVKLPGFIVPIGEPKNGLVREFYLVPYIGEDIHVPPPPSNQMVYVRSPAGVATDAVHEAYWVTGKIHVETRTTPLGTSAWSLVANKVEQYQY